MGANNPFRKMESIHNSQADAYSGQLKSLNTWNNNNVNRSFLDTSMGKSMSGLIDKQMTTQTNRAEGNAAIMGATNEASLAQKANINQGFGESINKLTQYGTQYQDSLRDSYFTKMMQLQGAIGQEKIGAQQAKADRRQQTFDNVLGAVDSASGVATALIPGGLI